MKKSRYFGVYTDGRNYYTLSRYGDSVYGERVIHDKRGFYHLWNQHRSKLCAAMHLKLRNFPFSDEVVLYLGASTGTTVSHVSDIAGRVYAVEISSISMLRLLHLAEQRDNIFPILADARNMKNFAVFVSSPSVIYQDISQRDQVDIFIRNMEYFDPDWGFLMLKTRTIDMRRRPRDILIETQNRIRKHFNIIEIIDISRFQKDHFAIVVRP